MKKFEEMDRTERNEITKLFACWLRPYTHEVIVGVLKRRDEILNNDFAMGLLRELAERTEKEAHDFDHSIGCLLDEFDTFAQYNPHNHPLTHAGSYRDILADMYIR